MIPLIGILAGLLACIFLPIQARQIRSGVMPKKFTGTREQLVAAFRKQLSLFKWLGLGLGAMQIVLIAIETEPGEWIVELIAGLLWFTLGGMSFAYDRALAKAAASGTV